MSLGIVAALLFGTEEGRKAVKNILDTIPDKYKQIPENLLQPKEKPKSPRTPIIEPLETPHHATYEFEAPPPPPPVIHPHLPQ